MKTAKMLVACVAALVLVSGCGVPSMVVGVYGVAQELKERSSEKKDLRAAAHGWPRPWVKAYNEQVDAFFSGDEKKARELAAFWEPDKGYFCESTKRWSQAYKDLKAHPEQAAAVLASNDQPVAEPADPQSAEANFQNARKFVVANWKKEALKTVEEAINAAGTQNPQTEASQTAVGAYSKARAVVSAVDPERWNGPDLNVMRFWNAALQAQQPLPADTVASSNH